MSLEVSFLATVYAYWYSRSTLLSRIADDALLSGRRSKLRRGVDALTPCCGTCITDHISREPPSHPPVPLLFEYESDRGAALRDLSDALLLTRKQSAHDLEC